MILTEPSKRAIKRTAAMLNPRIHDLDVRASLILRLARAHPLLLARAMERVVEVDRKNLADFERYTMRSKRKFLAKENERLRRLQARTAWRLRKFATLVREGPEAFEAEIDHDVVNGQAHGRLFD